MITNLLFGTSINELPVFNGRNYDIWKNRIETFIKSIDFEFWYVIVDGSYKSLITKKGKTREKVRKYLNENDKRMLEKLENDTSYGYYLDRKSVV